MESKTETGNRNGRAPYSLVFAAFSLALGVLVVVSAGLGYVKIPAIDVLSTLWDAVSGKIPASEETRAVILDVRLPRIAAALLVGAGLATAGAVFQGILLNPLSDPYTLGISAGAAFGAAVAIVLNTGFSNVSIPVCAFIGASATLFIVIFLAGSGKEGRGGLSSSNLILSGIMVSSILAAGISFLKYLADEQVSVIVFWLMGSFTSATWAQTLTVLSVIVPGFAIFIYYARDLNLMSLGERNAGTLGVDTRKITLVLLVTASFITAVCVSVSGIIGFVGLLVPHMARLMTGPDNRKLLPLSLVLGGLLLLSADTVTRAVLPSEIPIGVLTALIGGPVFCWLFKRHHMSRRS
jgi:iron complex transport system permease protein